MQWFYADGSDRQHEIAEADLATLVADGTLREDTLVWNETLPDWKPIGEVRPEFFGGAALPPALTSVQKKSLATLGPDHPGYRPPTDAVAVCALVFGALGLLCFPIFSIVGVICGHIALRRARETQNQGANRGLAISGIVTGYLGVLIMVVIVIVYGAVIFAAIASGELES